MSLSLFSPFFDLDHRLASLESSSGQLASFNPKVDVHEDETSITLHADLPGLKEEDVDITLNNQTLKISGERKYEHEEKEEDEETGKIKFRRVERSYGSFSRSMRVPKGVTSDDISASMSNGVLEVTVQKPAQALEEGEKKIAIEFK
eukprot:TRINITY_DN3891_c0_g3_i2.p1 TRINITY_DN3891_c0_g3~~TRINITY_DN3891_c0_g3_i2.p1  ORF type:complete len:147 (+),score=68.65 TRINITY_DN3891_c0_g3_i2:665-1105(+)